jgi:hypothetical protein
MGVSPFRSCEGGWGAPAAFLSSFMALLSQDKTRRLAQAADGLRISAAWEEKSRRFEQSLSLRH